MSGGCSLAAEGAKEGAFGVVLVDEIGAVAIGDVDIAIGREGDVGGREFGGGAAVFVEFVVWGLFGVTDAEDLFAAVDKREEFVAAFAGEVETVGAALEFAAPAADEFAFFVEDEEGIAGLAGAMDGLGYVGVALAPSQKPWVLPRARERGRRDQSWMAGAAAARKVRRCMGGFSLGNRVRDTAGEPVDGGEVAGGFADRFDGGGDELFERLGEGVAFFAERRRGGFRFRPGWWGRRV